MNKILLVSLSFVLLVTYGFFYLNRYHSAFEADQACHSLKWSEYGDSTDFGCDHDLEPRQWLLYEVGKNNCWWFT